MRKAGIKKHMASPRLAFCPPASAHYTEPFDRYIFQHKHEQPVHAEFEDGAEWRSNGIAYEDYSRMAIHSNKLSGIRRLETPAWALNNEMTRKVIVRYLEIQARPYRYAQQHPGPGTDRERLVRACAKLQARKPNLIETMDRLCHEYVDVKSHGGDPQRLLSLQCQIENIDTRLRLIDAGPAFLAGAIHYYYRAAYDSVNVAHAMNGIIKPVHVRQILRRLNSVAAKIAAGEPPAPAVFEPCGPPAKKTPAGEQRG